MLTSTDSKRLGPRRVHGGTPRSPGKGGIRRNLRSGLKVGGDGNMRDQVELGYRGGSTERDYCKRGAFRCRVKTWCIESP